MASKVAQLTGIGMKVTRRQEISKFISMFAKLDCSFLALVETYCQDFTRRNIIYVMSVPAPPTPTRNDQ
jgi:hypothetical protein